MISPGSGKMRCFLPLPRTCNCASASFRSSSWSARISQERRPSSNIKPTTARSRKVRKLAQNLVTCSAERGWMTRRGCFEAETEGDGAMGAAIAERAACRIDALEMGMAGGDLLSVMESIQTPNHRQAMIYGLRRRLGLLTQLMADIVQQRGFGDFGQGLGRL